MFRNWLCVSAASFLGGALAISSLATAAPRPLVGIDGNGNTIPSGWSWDVSAATEPLVNLVFIRVEGNSFFFEKDAEIRNASDPIVITFTKTDAQNAKNLVINDETVLNNSGESWNSFRMELSSGSTGGVPSFAFATSDGAPGLGDFNIDPFTAFQFYNANAGLLFTGGTVPTGATWFPGDQSQTGLAIVASSQADSFTLKEIAGSVIPLPSAAWTGLSTLFGLSLISGAKRVRKNLA